MSLDDPRRNLTIEDSNDITVVVEKVTKENSNKGSINSINSDPWELAKNLIEEALRGNPATRTSLKRRRLRSHVNTYVFDKAVLKELGGLPQKY